LDEAGGILAVMKELSGLIDIDTRIVTGETLEESLKDVRVVNKDIIRRLASPVRAEGGIAVLRGNLAPKGAVVRQAAVDAKMMYHVGPARVFDSMEESIQRLVAGDIQPKDVVVIRYEGPNGGPGMRRCTW
jgi:dihydroxy-acid dehydratase